MRRVLQGGKKKAQPKLKTLPPEGQNVIEHRMATFLEKINFSTSPSGMELPVLRVSWLQETVETIYQSRKKNAAKKTIMKETGQLWKWNYNLYWFDLDHPDELSWKIAYFAHQRSPIHLTAFCRGWTTLHGGPCPAAKWIVSDGVARRELADAVPRRPRPNSSAVHLWAISSSK